jgi:general secretion pathway protein A
MNLVSAVGRLPGLEERISVKTLLRTLTPDETIQYIRHRLIMAGATRELFASDALEAIHYLSKGSPRQINRLGDLALLVGYADRSPQLTARQIEAVSEELIAVAAE